MDKITEYRKKGVIRIPSVFTAEECKKIKQEAYLTSDAQIKAAGYNHTPAESPRKIKFGRSITTKK